MRTEKSASQLEDRQKLSMLKIKISNGTISGTMKDQIFMSLGVSRKEEKRLATEKNI